VDAVGRVDTRGVVGQRLRRQVQHGVGQVGVVLPALVLELAYVVGQDDAERALAGEAFLEVLAVALDRGRQGPQVHAIGADADGPAASAGAEGKDLVEAVEQPGPLFGLDQPLELRPVRSELGPGKPLGEVLKGLPSEAIVGGDRLETAGGPGQQVHEATSVTSTRSILAGRYSIALGKEEQSRPASGAT
jgi:hypothetical protein